MAMGALPLEPFKRGYKDLTNTHVIYIYIYIYILYISIIIRYMGLIIKGPPSQGYQHFPDDVGNNTSFFLSKREIQRCDCENVGS